MHKCEFVAEVSSNHNKNLKRCLQFVDEASVIGCDAVKFQLFKIEELFAPEILRKSPKHRDRKQWELPISFLPEIAARCLEKKIKFFCTPFYLKAVEELMPYIESYKIASYEILWKDLLSVCAQTGKPIVLSTGMATMPEVREAVKVLMDSGCHDLTLLHCVSSYPAPLSECNLSAIETLRKAFSSNNADCQVKIGWSDHSVSPAVLYRAVHRWEAEMVEFHFDLEGSGEEYGGGHCWLPDAMKTVIRDLRGGFSADGQGEKIPAASELADREWRADPNDGLRPLIPLRTKWKDE